MNAPAPRRPFLLWPDAALFAALLAAPSILMARALARGAIPYFMDPLMYFFPLRVHAARILAGGEWPLWNRCLMGGMPLLENPQSAILYPLNWPSLIWPGGFWFTFPQLLQLGLYGALTAWALRRIGLGRWTAFWAGALALAGSYGWSRLQFGNYLNVVAWWPLWLGAAHGAANAECGMRNAESIEESNPKSEIRNPKQIQNPNDPNESPGLIPHSAFRIPHFLLGVFAVAMALLSGAHQPAAYGLFALAFYAILQAAMDRDGRRRWIAFLSVTYIFGVLIAAPGWLPQIGFLRETARAGGVDPEQVLVGAVGSFGQLFTSLVGDWSLVFDRPPGRWADAEGQAAIGIVALALALIPARHGAPRRAWLALWIVALLTVALASRPVVALLLKITPLAGLFHDPRRWLGVTQWLLLPAAALGLERVVRRFCTTTSFRSKLAAAFLIATIAIQGILTLLVTDLAMLPDRHVYRSDFTPAVGRSNPGALMIDLPNRPMVQRADLQPGQRFIGIDQSRSSSYYYQRPDPLDWMVPNFGMLWGYEDLGGYEPAQSRRWREFTARMQDTPWRTLWPRHFSLPTAPWRIKPLDEGNVVAAVMPRWGLPLYLRREEERRWVTSPPELAVEPLSLLAVVGNGEDAMITLDRNDGSPAILFSVPERIGLQHDAIPDPTSASLLRSEPGGRRVYRMARVTTGPISTPPGQTAWELTINDSRNPYAEIHDVFFWNDRLTRSWQPVVVRKTAALMRYHGAPSRFEWIEGGGRVLNETIRHNRLEMECEVVSSPAALIVHDAFWPGWQAFLDNETPLPILPHGPWRRVDLPVGRHTLTMTYRPVWLPLALSLSAVGLLGCVLIALVARRRGSVPPTRS
jgi:hypothetical protein